MSKCLLNISLLILFSLTIIEIGLTLPLYGQTPTPSKASDKPEAVAKDNSEKSKTNQSISENFSPSGTLQISPKSDVGTPQDTNHHNDKSPSGWWLIGFTGALVMVGILQFVAMWCQYRVWDGT